jgi:Cdc6-like AAA superfamily ATPase
MAKKNAFFGYSSRPPSSPDSVEAAVRILNERPDIELVTWRKVFRGGSLMIRDILEKIDQADLCCFDLTGMNDNVLFELGYAIGKRRRIWLVFDTSYERDVNEFEDLGLLRDVGYVTYANAEQIVRAFELENPHLVPRTVYDRLIAPYEGQLPPTVLLHLRPQINSTASSQISALIQEKQLPVVTDDPTETRVQSLSWYVQHLHTAQAVLAEFSAQTRRGYGVQNSKCALVCGLALGMDLSVGMLVEKPYLVPSDYKSQIREYESAEQARMLATQFLVPVLQQAPQRLVARGNSRPTRRSQTELQSIAMGEYIAEHEISRLYSYYVDVRRTTSLVKYEHNIVVGRKGCGKTAALYYLTEELRRDVRNVVCVMTPISFQLSALIALIRASAADYQKEYLIEVSWKFLVYTEIARTFHERVSARPDYARTAHEAAFLDFVAEHRYLILEDLSDRLEIQLSGISSDYENILQINPKAYKERISEDLHGTVLSKLRSFFVDLAPKVGKIIVLMDNLDKSWSRHEELPVLSKCILGLLSVSGRMARDLAVVKSKQANLDFHLTIFLRTDIFKAVVRNAREPDKLENTELQYNDQEMLFRILDERLEILNPTLGSSASFWERYIVTKVLGRPTKDYLFEAILPRPRDLIFFIREAHDVAVARGHHRIEEIDVLEGYSRYSNWVKVELNVEDDILEARINDFLDTLSGLTQIHAHQDLVKLAIDTGVVSNSLEAETFLDSLVALSVLGREVEDGEFVFEYDFTVDRNNKIRAERRLVKNFKVHNALVPKLHLRPV